MPGLNRTCRQRGYNGVTQDSMAISLPMYEELMEEDAYRDKNKLFDRITEKLYQLIKIYEDTKIWDIEERKKEKDETLEALSAFSASQEKALRQLRTELSSMNSKVTKLNHLHDSRSAWELTGKVSVAILVLVYGLGFLKYAAGF